MPAEREEWFKWEREACVYHMDVVASAAMQPLREYFGATWPKTILVFRGDVVLWCNEMAALYALGQKMIDCYVQAGNQKKMLRDWSEREGALRAAFKKIDAEKLSKLPDAELSRLYFAAEHAYVDWYAIGWLAEPVALQGENLVRELLSKKGFESESKNFKRLFSLLTCTTRKSFNRREEEEFLEIAAKAKKASKSEVSKLLAEHVGRYFWLHNNYLQTTVLGEPFFAKELARVLEKHPEPRAYALALSDSAKELAEEKKKAVAELKLNEKESALIALVDLFGWFQDHRKEVILQSLHYLDLLLREIGRRSGFSEREIKQLLRSEIPLLLEKKIDKRVAANRLKNCVLIRSPENAEPAVFEGEAARKKEKNVFAHDLAARDVVEIRGSVASQGKARGYARVTMSASEANASLRSGEILVTSMTSPDFVTAVKRAAGIVTNEGGITCHAAIVSREFGIPCIVGTRIATKVLRTGDFIEVDGNHGFVRKLVKEIKE